ncbi:MAG: SPOR domain-containing protein [Pseudomonadota bacterium]
MRDLQPTGPREIWITRGHLWALAFMMVFVGVLAFFVGLLYGRSQAGTAAPVARPAELVDADVQDDALDELLARLEALDAAKPVREDNLSFPGTLGEGQPLAPPAEAEASDAVAEVLPGRVVPEAPPEQPEGATPPTSGWAIQVASFATVEEADSYIEALQAREVTAYRQAALVSGVTRYRVRVGGYARREAAQAALDTLTPTLGVEDAIVVRIE